MAKQSRYVYFFGDGKAEGNGGMKELLGGKGANLAEMAGHPNLRLPVPPGFTLTTEVCTDVMVTGHPNWRSRVIRALTERTQLPRIARS